MTSCKTATWLATTTTSGGAGSPSRKSRWVPGSDEVADLLQQTQAGKVGTSWMTWVTMGEVATIVERRWGKGRLYQALGRLEATWVEVVVVDRELALTAAGIKAEHPLAYADAFAAALAVTRQATLVTGDPEFKILEPGLSIRWLGQGG